MNQALWFGGNSSVEIRQEPPPSPEAGQVVVASRLSAISAGTEMLFYRGQVPPGMAVDDSIEALARDVAYPLKYGYAVVGEVVDASDAASAALVGKRVFALHPHESTFVVRPDELTVLPDDLADEDAAFLANAETAINLTMDGRPAVGEQVAVIGQGVVGLLLTASLSRFPLSRLVSVDLDPRRRELSLEWGATSALDAATLASGDLRRALGSAAYDGADLVYEVSGNPAALDLALEAAGHNGRVVVGSWYGAKSAPVNLGGRFHRDRVSIYSSQVSTINPDLSARWSSSRRLAQAVDLLRHARPARLVSHRFAISDAAEAYRLLSESGGQAVQVLLTY